MHSTHENPTDERSTPPEPQAETRAASELEGALPHRTDAEAEAKPPTGPAVGGAEEPAGGNTVREQALEMLSSKGRRLNLVEGRELHRSIEEAVTRALQLHLAGELHPERLAAIPPTARKELVALLRQRARSVRGLSEKAFLAKVSASRDQVLSERERARAELEQLLVELSGKNRALQARESVLAQESAAAGAWHDKVMAERIREAFAALPDLGPQAQELQNKIIAIALAGMQGERQNVIDQKVAEHRTEIEQYRRRLAKLTSTLELTEEQMAKLAAAKGIEGGIASIYDSVQGIDSGDLNRQKKIELMEAIFEANLEMRDELAEARLTPE